MTINSNRHLQPIQQDFTIQNIIYKSRYRNIISILIEHNIVYIQTAEKTGCNISITSCEITAPSPIGAEYDDIAETS
ncbi:hypothetical protein SAMN05216325_103209 [Nitrosomonas marina]|uniref:Uncharacterized protein n=1 Tax=Nitrosomonas marina TaxID=917 RepID=A0A1H8C1D8_9PROT|nr:hypothetical protein SAMN05216325_103209 [Nitrosomonas marina]